MNWGHKLTIGIVSFMAFIIALVVLMFTYKNNDTLIDSDYYEKGQLFDTDYQAKTNAEADQFYPVITSGKDSVTVSFRSPVSYEIFFRRLSDSKLDKNYNSTSESSVLKIPAAELKAGPWSLRISYSANGKSYLFEERIVLP